MSSLMPTIVPISEAKPRLAALIDASDTEDVILTRRGRAAAVLVSAQRYSDLLDRVEDLEDSLAVARSRGEQTISASDIISKYGIDADAE
ncbi:MAG: type II toxin-antitoxin system Phd/YefM family antitoxin [Propionibacteriaceae bacterium]|jgi:prevent-host-death family protein|nr:type II toxin-antitoxin system Phd/YefM family antitoxin [Propionibacteriaceae bacterium]